jgi:hypothetical protein
MLAFFLKISLSRWPASSQLPGGFCSNHAKALRRNFAALQWLFCCLSALEGSFFGVFWGGLYIPPPTATGKLWGEAPQKPTRAALTALKLTGPPPGQLPLFSHARGHPPPILPSCHRLIHLLPPLRAIRPPCCCRLPMVLRCQLSRKVPNTCRGSFLGASPVGQQIRHCHFPQLPSGVHHLCTQVVLPCVF